MHLKPVRSMKIRADEVGALIIILVCLVFLVGRWLGANRASIYEEDTGLGLNSLLFLTKQELQSITTDARTRNEFPLFDFKSVDLELSFTTKRVTRRDGKVEYRLVAVEKSDELTNEQVQKITLHMDIKTKEIMRGQSISPDQPP
jgi:hypothetical protein